MENTEIKVNKAWIKEMDTWEKNCNGKRCIKDKKGKGSNKKKEM